MCKKDVTVLKIKETFWQDVLESWCDFNYNNNIRVENQLIWYNSLIRVKDKPIMWNDVYSRGLKYVHQLFESGHFRNEKEMFEKYGISKLRYNSLKVSIPSSWKTVLQR